MQNNELVFLPLGGVGEFGANLSLYGYDGKWLIVDCGMSFADDELPGIDLTFPDIRFIAERKQDLIGIVLTHAHEDHIGAVATLWPELKCPVYGTPFALALLRSKLEEAGLTGGVPLFNLDEAERHTIGPFQIEPVAMTHSIPESRLLRISTPLGRIIHTGDWKLDPDPVVGPVTDYDGLKRFAADGVDVLIGDSTGAMSKGRSRSEGVVQKNLIETFKQEGQRIVVVCFSSNVARVESITRAAMTVDRHVVLAGRSLLRMVDIAKSCGYLQDLPPFVTTDHAGFLPRENTVIVCTGSQGEPRSAMPAITEGRHPHIALDPGDTVIFSSRAIPGNEKAILRMQNRLVARGIKVITDSDAPIHGSGHPSQEELRELYSLLQPKTVVPVHGEIWHLSAHKDFVEENKLAPATARALNGRILKLLPGPVEMQDEIELGKMALDGKALKPVGGESLKVRRKVLIEGNAVITLVANKDGHLIAEPQISAPGLILNSVEGDALRNDLIAAVKDDIASLKKHEKRDDDLLRKTARIALRRHVHKNFGKKPVTDVHIVRV